MIAKLVALTLFLLTLLPDSARAAQWIPELDEVGNQGTNARDNMSKADDVNRTAAMENKLLSESRVLYAEGKYAEALQRARLAEKFYPYSLNRQEIAKCVAHIGRPVEALHLLGKAYDLPTAVEVFETLGMHEQALKACSIPDGVNETAYVLRSELLLKHGRRQEALDYAQQSFWHFIRSGSSAPQLDQFMRNAGVVPIENPPPVADKNQAVFIALENLRQAAKPTGKANLEHIYRRKFYICSKGPGFINCASYNDEAAVLRTITWSPQDMSDSQDSVLGYRLNCDQTFITEAQMRDRLKDCGEPSITESHSLGGDRPDSVLRTVYYPDAKIRLFFSSPTNQLSAIEKFWPHPLSSQQSRPGASGSASGKIAETPAARTARAKHELAAYQYRKAARDLMIAWVQDNGTDSDHWHRLCLQRQLLIDCYTGMKEPEIADYLRAAPFDHIAHQILYGDCNPDKSFPPLEEYMHRLWKVQGPAQKDKGRYLIHIDYVGVIDVYDYMPAYAGFYQAIGPIDASEPKEIAPLPAELMDNYQYHVGGS